MSFFGQISARLSRDRGLRPAKRSNSLVSIANSLSTIAYALKIIVLKEYHVDLDAPQPTRADRTREVFEPIYSNNEKEAIREELERIEQIELELAAADAAESPKRAIAMQFGRSKPSGSEPGEDIENLTSEERAFLAELDSNDSSDSSGEER